MSVRILFRSKLMDLTFDTTEGHPAVYQGVFGSFQEGKSVTISIETFMCARGFAYRWACGLLAEVMFTSTLCSPMCGLSGTIQETIPAEYLAQEKQRPSRTLQ